MSPQDKRLKGGRKRQSGLAMIEYALLAVLIALGIVAVVASMGIDLRGEYQKVHDAFSGL